MQVLQNTLNFNEEGRYEKNFDSVFFWVAIIIFAHHPIQGGVNEPSHHIWRFKEHLPSLRKSPVVSS